MGCGQSAVSEVQQELAEVCITNKTSEAVKLFLWINEDKKEEYCTIAADSFVTKKFNIGTWLDVESATGDVLQDIQLVAGKNMLDVGVTAEKTQKKKKKKEDQDKEAEQDIEDGDEGAKEIVCEEEATEGEAALTIVNKRDDTVYYYYDGDEEQDGYRIAKIKSGKKYKDDEEVEIGDHFTVYDEKDNVLATIEIKCKKNKITLKN